MEKERKEEGVGATRGGCLESVFEIYALLATGFSLRLWLVRRQEGRR